MLMRTPAAPLCLPMAPRFRYSPPPLVRYTVFMKKSHKSHAPEANNPEVTPVDAPATPGKDAAGGGPATEQAPPAVSTPPVDPRDLEIAVLKDRLLRLQADFDNFRKRTVRDREDMVRRASEKILKELLPAVDHFDLGLQAAHKHHVKHAVLEGLEGVLKQFQSVLEKSGVTPIESKGQAFDPHVHECVAQIPSEEHPEGVVIEETRKGYRIGTFVLRASQVIVSAGPATAAPPPPPAGEPTAPAEPPA